MQRPESHSQHTNTGTALPTELQALQPLRGRWTMYSEQQNNLLSTAAPKLAHRKCSTHPCTGFVFFTALWTSNSNSNGYSKVTPGFFSGIPAFLLKVWFQAEKSLPKGRAPGQRGLEQVKHPRSCSPPEQGHCNGTELQPLLCSAKIYSASPKTHN